MKETKTYRDILDKIKDKKNCILRCWGVPGSGKSEIVRKLAVEFPFTNGKKSIAKGVVKWHIQCKDSEHDVIEELQKLTDELFKKGHIQEKETCDSIKNELRENRCDKLFHQLQSCSFHVLIIIEDPDPYEKNPNKNLLQDFLRKLSSNDSQLFINDVKMHLYITSRKSNPILHKDETKNKNINVKINVTGFDKEEALQYLLEQSPNSNNEADAQLICERFGGLPLGLLTTKRYCDETRTDYTDYLKDLKEREDKIISEEREKIKKEFGDSAEHVFSAVTLPFLPAESDDLMTCLHWKILKCLSYFNYDRIPRFAVEHCFNLIISESQIKRTKRDIEKEVGKLTTKLLEHSMCSETDEKEITFHEVVSHAFRSNSHSIESKPFNPLYKAIEIMSGLISKDMFMKERSHQMFKLRRHAQTILEHFENQREDNSVMLKALASHLYDTTGAIMVNESPALFLKKSEEYFDKALDLISFNQENLKYKGQEFEPNLADNIVKESQEKGKTLDDDFTIDYAAKLCFDKDEIKSLKSKSSSQDCFKKVEELIESTQSKKSILVEMRKCNLFLPERSYVKIFYAERIASILHSYSRIVLYSDLDEGNLYDKCIWMTKLSNQIAENCKTKCDVPLLVEHLSKIGGLIPIILKVNKSSIDDNIKVLEFSKDALLAVDETSRCYENGMLKEVYGPSFNWTQIRLLRYITKANTRLLKLDENKMKVKDADSCCNKLFNLSIKFCEKMSICTRCFIYCAKYYAARKNFKESMKCFDTFFEKVSDKPFYIYCWAVYNYVRAIEVCTRDDLWKDVAQEREICLNDALNKSNEILNSKKAMSKHLKEKLTRVLEIVLEQSGAFPEKKFICGDCNFI